jgi:hypothetical protein
MRFAATDSRNVATASAACLNGTAHTALLIIENVELKACGRKTTGFFNVHLHQQYSAAILRSCKQAARIS